MVSLSNLTTSATNVLLLVPFSIIVRTSGGKIEAYLNGVGWIYSTQSLESGKWYYISATYDGHFLKLYINGILQATSADTAITISDSSDFFSFFVCCLIASCTIVVV